MHFVPQTIGFDAEVERAAIMEAGLNQFDEFRYLVSNMASEFSKRTQAQGCIVFR